MKTQFKSDPKLPIYSLSEQAVTIEFGREISQDILEVIPVFDRSLNQYPFPGFIASVPAYTTLSVFFDPVKVIQSNEMPGAACFEKVCGYLSQLHEKQENTTVATGNIVIIPVCYDAELGPDIAEVAKIHNMTVDAVIQLHSAAEYSVHMIGFMPGFAYLGGMTESLATPRKGTPRNAVPAGSVGIAGKQTGIYPLQTPGGWQLIGQTPVKLFDANRVQPSLLKAGDRVIFKPITRLEFDHLAAAE
ncbi:5-oxoprolinase subunit PxpB [Mucilaginibacter sp.]|uniref:5-oxoprolinase subunit PxpB n=1 Tax=Mucilaginibacter sp. TaxID=1882438 RepID=UPI0025D3AB16|nr:5-oxoprolinase subunit PxpB [Mucilaginibacter sp.]